MSLSLVDRKSLFRTPRWPFTCTLSRNDSLNEIRLFPICKKGLLVIFCLELQVCKSKNVSRSWNNDLVPGLKTKDNCHGRAPQSFTNRQLLKVTLPCVIPQLQKEHRQCINTDSAYIENLRTLCSRPCHFGKHRLA